MGKPLLSLFRLRAAVPGLLLAAAVFALSATEASASELYTAEVPLEKFTLDARRDAYVPALKVVLSRVSASDTDRLMRLFPDPSDYVVQFRPIDGDLLRVSFDGAAIERALTAAGETFWGDERPLTLVWLAIDWGNGQREILASSDAGEATDVNAAQDLTDERADSVEERNEFWRKQILDVAERRGIPILFPLVDVDDLQSVTFSDIWGGFDEAVVDASRRYAVDSILIGRVRADRPQSSRWTHIYGSESMTIAGLPELAIVSVADRLASVFSIGGNDTLRTVRLFVSGVTSIESYGFLQKTLDELSVVQDFSVRSVQGDQIEYAVTAHGGAQRLSRALGVKGLIAEERLPIQSVDGVVQPRAPADDLFFYLDR